MQELFTFVEPFAGYFRQTPVVATVWVYLIIMNVYVFFLCRHDKLMAIRQRQRQRVPERDFFVLSFFGGSPGMLLGMYAFRHKTKHISFVLGIPFIIVVQICLVLLVMYDGDISLIRDAASDNARNLLDDIKRLLS